MFPSLLLATLSLVATPERVFIPAICEDDTVLCPALERAMVEGASAQGYSAMSTVELRGLVDIEVEKQLVGCEDDASCLSEIAEAIGAPLTVVSQLSKLGDTQTVLLTLLDTVNAKVVRRDRADGEEAEQLVDETRLAMKRLLPSLLPAEPPPVPQASRGGPSMALLGTGATSAALGVFAAGLGVVPLFGLAEPAAAADAAAINYVESNGDPDALRDLEDAHNAHRLAGDTWNGLGVTLVAAGAIALVVGGALVGAAFIE